MFDKIAEMEEPDRALAEAAKKFGSRYATLGSSDQAHLDDGDLWPSSCGVTVWTDEVERRVVELVKRVRCPSRLPSSPRRRHVDSRAAPDAT